MKLVGIECEHLDIVRTAHRRGTWLPQQRLPSRVSEKRSPRRDREALKRTQRNSNVIGGTQKAISRLSAGHQQAIRKPSEGHQKAISRPSAGHARPCSAMLGHARPCSAMLGHARPCSAMLGHARERTSVPKRTYSQPAPRGHTTARRSRPLRFSWRMRGQRRAPW